MATVTLRCPQCGEREQQDARIVRHRDMFQFRECGHIIYSDQIGRQIDNQRR